MLTISPLSNNGSINEREIQMDCFSMDGNEFPDFSIDFDDLFLGISDGDSLPDLEMDPEILAEFSLDDEFMMNAASEAFDHKLEELENSILTTSTNEEKETMGSVSLSDLGSGTSSVYQAGEEIVSKRDERRISINPSKKEVEKAKKSCASSKNQNHPGKRKVKVDWTPELHRRFVQAVEQLGVDKAVPSRILEIMGIDCLTRHNIASHLQKYRSHRKHLLAREAEAANWSQRRQIYVPPPTPHGVSGKRDVNTWIAPTMGFPPVAPMPPYRPLHVWGHPSVDQSMAHMWPKHMAHPPPPPQAWPPAQHPHLLRPTPADASYWHSYHHQHAPTPGTPYFPPHMQTARFPVPQVPGILQQPPPMYKVPLAPQAQTTLPQPPSDIHPSKESVDAAIGDVLSKPWMPLPLGLKPPSMDSVMVELQRQGIPKIPPTCV